MPDTLANKVRLVTAASLFDGHDAAINIMRRILQSKGAEIIHLGHNRSVHEIVEAAIEEDVQGIAITSYQGGHVEFFKYMKDLLDQNGCGHIKIFGGGGGTILPQEIEELHNYGITKIYSPDDGRKMGLEGMISEVIALAQTSQTHTPGLLPASSGGGGVGQHPTFNIATKNVLGKAKDVKSIAGAITMAENGIRQEKSMHYDGSSITVGQFKADPMIYKKLKDFSLSNRHNSTVAEQVLWDKLRSKKEGYKFRRQHIIGQFIADFVCLKKGLVVELDGNYHQLPEMKVPDAERTRQLNELGFAVQRFTNDEVLYNINNVTESIHTKLQQLPDKKIDEDESMNEQSQLPNPSPTGGRWKGAVLGITGTGGAGKSSVTDELVRRYLNTFTDKTIAVISVDPSRKKTGGALLGDRIRMNAISHPRAYMRSMATRSDDASLSEAVQDAIDICKDAAFDLIILESAGVGQSDASILDYCDVSMYIMTPEYGAASQLEKINMLDYADVVCLNKFDKAGALDALHDVRKQYKRNHSLWTAKDDELPVVGTIAAQFNDDGVNKLFSLLLQKIKDKTGVEFGSFTPLSARRGAGGEAVIPARRVRYLSEISENNRAYDAWVKEQSAIATKLYQLNGTLDILNSSRTNSINLSNQNTSQPSPTGGDTEGASSRGNAQTISAQNASQPSPTGGDTEGASSRSNAQTIYAQNTSQPSPTGGDTEGVLQAAIAALQPSLHPDCKKLLEAWPSTLQKYSADFFEYTVRDKVIKQPLTTTTLSGTRVPRVVLPKYKDWGDILTWQLQENLPGEFPYTAGVFELKRQGEDPTRMFAGEGGPERTNRRFHYVSAGQPAKRLSTAFDSVTLYGEDPAVRPDIYGKIGNSGVSIATVDDAKKLYSGFDLCSPQTSVSMTINGPAAIILAFFMNAAIDQLCEKHITELGMWDKVRKISEEKYKHLPKPIYHNPSAPGRHPLELQNRSVKATTASDLAKNASQVSPTGGDLEGAEATGLNLLGLSGDEVLPPDTYARLAAEALSQVRGTVQADILKEDQAQNTCIFSTEFALKLMGDVQEYFITNKVRNFYSVSISGYHIAEAGANPITQLAFTLANGFTFVEYYLSRGMHIDDFAPNLSFFFSNGMDAEYSVIGRVARRIWAKAMKNKYKGNDRSQKLKYHIQTSGRSLHAQEIDFNDIRTTLQALYAIYDNCNSLHTNAYDEAITTPTEESVRRAMAIQLIINRELGSAKTENFIQGSFIIEELTNLVEEAVLTEFDRINERGGVLGAMERMYQRNKIQEESLAYEHLKHTGELPIVGVNTFLNKKGSPTILPSEVIRSTTEEKDQQIANLDAFKQRNQAKCAGALQRLKQTAISNGNLFAELMETVKYCTLGQITHALYEVGGQYRRNM